MHLEPAAILLHGASSRVQYRLPPPRGQKDHRAAVVRFGPSLDHQTLWALPSVRGESRCRVNRQPAAKNDFLHLQDSDVSTHEHGLKVAQKAMTLFIHCVKGLLTARNLVSTLTSSVFFSGPSAALATSTFHCQRAQCATLLFLPGHC